MPDHQRKLWLISQIYKRDGRRCFYCGRSTLGIEEINKNTAGIPKNYPTLDHIIPRSRGGRWVLWNLRIACKDCNVSKGSDMPLVWLTDKRVPCMHCHGFGHIATKACDVCVGKGDLDFERALFVADAAMRELNRARMARDETAAQLEALTMTMKYGPGY